MGASYRVTAPYVTLKVKDVNGQAVVVGYYEGAVVTDVDPESLKAHLDSGMVEKVSASDAPTSGPAAAPASDDGKGRKPAPPSK